MLSDANAYGEVGPPFDGNTGLTKANAVQTIKSGRGAMPSFSGQLSDAEISALADYILAYKR
jgi:mono/diheme cytochrome c family protein